MLITEEYQVANRLLHSVTPHYGAGGWSSYLLASWVVSLGYKDILDYGCGKGFINGLFNGTLKEYDPAIPGKDKSPQPADVVICRDVLEHVEPECLDDVFADLRRVTKQVGIFEIDFDPSQKTLHDGRNAHLIIRPVEWWIKQIMVWFKLNRVVTMNIDDLLPTNAYAMHTGIFVVVPRC